MATSSDAFDVFRLAYLEGLRIELTAAGAPTVRNGEPSLDLLATLKQHRAAIIATATDQGIGATDPGCALPRRYVIPGGCLARLACPRLGPCSQSLMGHPCDHVMSGGTT